MLLGSPHILILLHLCVVLQALAQELNFSAYLGLPVFMIPISGPNNANLARLLLNHIHTGHHTSNVRPAHARNALAPSVGSLLWDLLFQFWIHVPLMAPEDMREDLIDNEPLDGVDDASVEEKTWSWLVFTPLHLPSSRLLAAADRSRD